VTIQDTATKSGIPHCDVLTDAASEILSVSCGVDVAESADTPPTEGSIIVAVISLVGDVEWSMFLGLPQATAEKVAAKFAGFEIPFDSEDMGDVVGEITNVVAGQVKLLLDARGVKGDISLPSVLRAENMEVLSQRDASGFRTCFTSELGPLWVGLLTGGA
jgi:CheY-specific phosphatase CheX